MEAMKLHIKFYIFIYTLIQHPPKKSMTEIKENKNIKLS